jgi:hypothetical protein
MGYFSTGPGSNDDERESMKEYLPPGKPDLAGAYRYILHVQINDPATYLYMMKHVSIDTWADDVVAHPDSYQSNVMPERVHFKFWEYEGGSDGIRGFWAEGF